MIKKLVCLSLVGLFASPMAMADGFYVGAGAGAMYAKTKMAVDSSVTSNVKTTATSNDDYPTDIGLNTALLLGYGHTFKNRAYIGLEGFGNWPSVKTEGAISGTYVSNSADLSFNSVYGFRMLAGYQLSAKTTAYGIVGYARAKVQSNTTATGNVLSDPGLDTTASSDETLNGYQFGLGAMRKISEHISLRADAIYSAYEHTSSVTTTSSNGVLSNSVQQTPYTIETDLSLLYQFG
jgi:hypothetical protein